MIFRMLHSSFPICSNTKWFRHHILRKNLFDGNCRFTRSLQFKSELNIAVNQMNNFSLSNKPVVHKIVGIWLLTCSGMVFTAVVIGGITRLTESGLSMVTWKLFGENIPFDEGSWLNEFEKYKQYPEFQLMNQNMSLRDFKKIWWMEYFHRMWGRLIGVVFIIPASYFWIKNKLPSTTKIKVSILGFLIGCQGLMGWYMVKSGLENDFDGYSDIPRVSQYRLAAHFGLALTIYSGFLYSSLDHLLPVTESAFITTRTFTLTNAKSQTFANYLEKLRLIAYSTKGLIFLTAISGAFVAGLDAGLICSSFPKMFDRWIPDEFMSIKPTIKNFTENAVTVQFNHRVLGMLTLLSTTCIGLMSLKHKLHRRTYAAILTVIASSYLQATLGILTVVNHVPIHLAALHQSGSLVLLSAIIWLCHEIKYLKKIIK